MTMIPPSSPFDAMINIDPMFALGQLRLRMERELRSLRNALRSLEDGSYDARGRQGTATGPFGIGGGGQVEAEQIAQDECAKSFLSITRAFIDFIDTLIGLKQFIADGVTGERDILSHEDLTNYVKEKIAEFAREVGARTSMTNPKKLERLGNLPIQWQEAVLAYFQVRRSLEHLKQVPDRDIEYRTWRLGVVIDGGEEFQQLPCSVEVGQSIGRRGLTLSSSREAGGQMLIYRDGALQLPVRLDGQTVWLTQRARPELYQVPVPSINEHLRHIFSRQLSVASCQSRW